MDLNNPYFKQVELLVQMLPVVAQYDCFALKGGTAINLFVRDMPRLSVDIDLTYIPVNKRDDALAEIDGSFRSLKDDLTKRLPGLCVTGSELSGTKTIYKLLTQLGNTQVKIEISPVMRGVVDEPVQLETSVQTQDVFGYASVLVVSFNDLYAGKLCAALNRQHPRDLFDVSMLLRNEGISEELLPVFLVYLVCGNRPIVELLAPIEQSIDQTSFHEFQGMTTESVSMDELQRSRSLMVKQINEMLTDKHKQFLLTFKRGKPDWNLLNMSGIEQFPAIQWKLHNINKMPKQKHKVALEKLEKVLYG
ncbi:MAG: nucleotidyl transferase AbiEii/AbiGii toxin family protein [Gammaproteobacteria bacterium]|nr:MAG: nucleotidyl transferase AbiEii/AbiGii toxin family protein [Gammaproteobacteria bacterium]